MTTQTIPGTTLFGGAEAIRGYGLNALCFSLNRADNRAAFLADEEAYADRYALTPAQKAALKSRQLLALIEAGGNIYYLAKLAGLMGWNMQDIGAQQTGLSLEAFNRKLLQETF